MRKFLLSFFAIVSLWLAVPCYAQYYDFSAVAPSGQTLYYSYDGGGVSVVRPNSSNNGYITGDLIIPDSVFYNDVWNPVVSIGFSAFRYCRDMTSVYIPNSVTSIGGRAFGSCSSLTSFNIPNSVTSIGNNEFEYCTSLTSVYIPVSVTVINSRAFNHCTSLTSISIPDFVTFIDEFAFFGCSSLTDITIPNFVTYIGEKAFASCPSINSMTVSPGNPVYDSRDSCNAIVETANNKLHSGCKSTIIPNSITSIGNYAFYECSSMTSISIPYSITSVGLEAFLGCVFDTLNMGHFEPPTFYLNANIINIPCGATINYQNSWGDRNYHEPDVDITLSLSAIASDGTAAIIPQNGHMVLCSDSSAVILATPNYGYHFTQWTNGSTDNPDTLYLSGDSAVTAFFAKNLYNVVGIVNDSERGTVFGSNFVEYLDTVILTATANYGYHFTQWNDGNTDNPREVVATGDLSFTAQFDYNQYNITLNVDEAIHGTVTGAGDYDYLSQRTITANAEYGYHFTQWHDGNTDNPRTITLTQDTSFTAQFAKNLYSVAGASEEYSSPRGVVTGGETVEYLNTVTLTATANYGYHFTQWNDGNTDNPREVVATGDLSFTAQFDYNQYNITLNVDEAIHGTVTGAGDYDYLSQRTITANAEYGYHFTQWHDGNTDNPRTITLTQDTSFTAQFAKNLYSVAGTSEEYSSPRGEVTGSETVEYLGTVTLTATANYGYHFTQWNDGNTDNPREVVATGDLSFTAQFDYNQYNITLNVDEAIHGTVGGAGSYDYLSQKLIYASANYGYHFLQWNDGNTDNPRIITLTQDTAFTAQFDYNKYNIILNVDEAIHGTVGGAGNFNYLSQRTISATANYGYHFTQWHDGNTDNPRTIILTQDTTFTAQFAKNLYSVVGVSQDDNQGTVTGSDTVEYLDMVTLTVTPNYGYHFIQWNDGNTDNPRQVQATQDLSFTAQFDYNQYNITLNVDTTIHGTVDGAGSYNYLSQRTISATANYGYHFTQWHDGNTDNPRTITLTQDTAFTAQFAKNSYTLTVSSNDSTLGSVSGSGTYEYLDTATLTATIIADHHHFVQWSDGVTDTLRTITVTGDLSLTAIFAIDTLHVTLSVNNTSYGSVGGDGDYPYGSTATVTANPYNGYYFLYWNNCDTNNPNIFTVTADTLLTAIFAPEITPSLCMVTVQDDHNVLMWEKDQTVLEYNIYREGTVSGVYELMTTIPYSSQSTWTDISSQPSTRSYRYRISATDVNGHEAGQSEIHKTMHLTINQGYGNQWNLVWTEYEGVDYTTYVIYRGRTLSEMEQIDVMPSGGNTSYTDVAPPTGSNKIYYQVGIILSTPCNPTKNEDVVLSNIATNDLDGIEDVLLSNLQVYANNEQIVVNSEIEVKEVQIFDISGKLLKSVFVNGNNSVINTTDFAAGVYIVRVNTTNGPVTRKVVKR